MSNDPHLLSDAQPIGWFIDGPTTPAIEQELARRITAQPALGRQLRQHLCIAELAHQQHAAERRGDNFTAGWSVRLAAEADAAVFTARTVLRLIAEERGRHSERVVWLVRLGGLSAAAGLLIGCSWASSAVIDVGRGWLRSLAATPSDNQAYAQRHAEFQHFRDTMR